MSEQAEQAVGDHQAAARAGSDPEGIMTLAAAIKLSQQANQPRKTSDLPPPGSVGSVMEGRYVPTLSLDPLNVKAITGFEAHAGYVQCAVDAFSTCHVGLKALSDAREQVKRDPSKTEAQQILLIAGEAEKLQNRMTRAMDTARTRLLDGIKSLDESLSKPIQTAADNSISAEVRKYVHDLPDDKRMGFLNDAMKRKDVATLSAVLGAQPFLSGLTHEMQAYYTRSLHEKQQPEIAARLGVMRKALALVEQRSGLIFNEIEKALGARWDVVQRLRKTQDSAAQALLLINPVKA